jgi:hypothetical protein
MGAQRLYPTGSATTNTGTTFNRTPLTTLRSWQRLASSASSIRRADSLRRSVSSSFGVDLCGAGDVRFAQHLRMSAHGESGRNWGVSRTRAKNGELLRPQSVVPSCSREETVRHGLPESSSRLVSKNANSHERASPSPLRAILGPTKADSVRRVCPCRASVGSLQTYRFTGPNRLKEVGGTDMPACARRPYRLLGARNTRRLCPAVQVRNFA